MKKLLLAVLGLALGGSALAENVSESNRLLCSTNKVLICFETGECIEEMPELIGMPQFIVIDVKRKLLSTTKASNLNRATEAATLQRENGKILLQGVDLGRAFSILIDETTGFMTGSVARDGFTVSGFGSCTDANL